MGNETFLKVLQIMLDKVRALESDIEALEAAYKREKGIESPPDDLPPILVELKPVDKIGADF